ncbi:hypothetical protein NECAME_09839 [Necator americanus]|uniref:Tryptophan synthase beta chain-like PALP domain-containing protein n=1 Tax=Necator americanus TaxID=51031 RepID=W2TE16_NECAM|nr:hypothetical protein NECAME_09839 [Necator americanus]ETN79436.1 hypothetical protein NECAME_09839 [Necator americanus]
MKVDVSLRNFHAKDQAEKNDGFFINQFGNAEYAEEFHESGGDNHETSNVFHEILQQLKKDEKQKKKIPDYFVHSAGTGGTISSVGRYTKRYNIPTRILLSDSEFSLFHDYVISNKFTNESGTKIWKAPGVAGIGYGYNVKPIIYGETTSLTRNVVDESMKMPDIASAAAMHVLRERGIGGGASTGLNFLVSLHKAYQLKDKKRPGRLTIVTIICDPGEFYESTYFNSTWIDKMFSEQGGMKGLDCWKNVSLDIGKIFTYNCKTFQIFPIG